MADLTESAAPSPSDGNALIAQALACRQAGQLAEAARLFALAVKGDPANSAVRLVAAETLYRLGRLFAARDAITAALAGMPQNAEAEFLLGRVLTGLGRSAESVAAFERALAHRPDNALALRFLACALYALGRRTDAEAAFERADVIQAEPGEFYNQLGIDLLGQRRSVEAEAAFRRAVKLAPRLAAAHQNLGVALAAQELLEAAIAAEVRAVKLSPNSAAAWNNRAVFEGSGGDFSDARRAAQRALQLEPDHPDALNTLAQIRLEEGDARASLELIGRVLARQPGHRAAGGALLMNQTYVGAGSLAETRNIAARLRPDGPPFTFERHDRNPSRRLRVGYVSADFRQHSCASFIKPLFAAHDPQAVEIFAYSENPRDDDVTTVIRGRTAAWKPIVSLGDPAVAELVHRDRIDILVDLSGHTAGNRLPVFALKPAPVQVTWLGYPATTGLAEIDYRLTDARADPAESPVDAAYTENLWRLPECFICYQPDPAAPAAGQHPDRDAVTFGSFNHLPKVTPGVVAAWSQILAQVPRSRLIMKGRRLGDPEVARRYVSMFASHGISGDRLTLVGWKMAPADHFALYDQVDIALDPFPYNGTTTTCEALWMGVPVVTLAGNTHAGRVGQSLLHAVGLETFIARTIPDYVGRAAALAQKPDERAALRQTLRDRMRASALCDAPAFARRFEAAFRAMWQRWCADDGKGGP
ncbi:MAG: tetratricopeptide repeat protein, partial [Alphaproteobacteria bacterium]|nr:tetratricopeptide repeat protein [Alphaproteobacteria bacterium]